jgi:CHAT domain-containing protein
MWEVQFGTGREFMKSMYTDFYRRSGQGESVLDLAVALQETVKRMKEDPNKSQPYHWAAFVLHGSWFYP